MSLLQDNLACVIVQGEELKLSVIDRLIVLAVTAVLVLRIWYTHRDARLIRMSVVLFYVGNAVAFIILMIPVWREIAGKSSLKILDSQFGCATGEKTNAWTVFVPGMVMYSVIYAATAVPVMREWYYGRQSPIMHRILRK